MNPGPRDRIGENAWRKKKRPSLRVITEGLKRKAGAIDRSLDAAFKTKHVPRNGRLKFSKGDYS